MSYLPDSNDPTRDRRTEYGLADKRRAEKRKQDETLIDPAASKWRYRPVPRAAKTPE
jgi:hypothetical protein